VVVLTLVGVGDVPAIAAPGDLDPGFGSGGSVTTLFPDGSFAQAVAIQPDGKIVAVGAAAGPSLRGEFAVARYETDGSPDAGFGEDGMVTTAIAGGGDEARSVAIQPNGKIVVAGTDSGERFAVVRYLPDGTLDPGFGIDGIVRTDLTTGDDIGFDVVIQPDGRIVVAGTAQMSSAGSRFAVVRYRRGGGLDRGFGEGGASLGERGTIVRSVALRSDGGIVVTGYDEWGLLLARVRPNGRLDGSFGRGGIVARIHGTEYIFPLAVAIQANGRIVVAGDYDIFRTGIARFTEDGRLDVSFHGDGVRIIRFGSGGEQAFNGLAIDADGRIVASGYAVPHEYGDPVIRRMLVARLLRNGELDTTWGGDGKVSATLPGGAVAHGLALQSDGKPVVAGEAGEGDAWGFALARFLA
jgi:uncharacterized delta-60 repeat protein